MTTPHAAIVLAAGGSTRLGRPKQLLRREGEALVARAVRLVGDTGPSRLVVMLGASRDAVAAELHAAPGAELHDVAAWRTGLSASLRAAAHVLLGHSGPVLITGVDQPALDAAHLRALLDGARAAPSGCAALMHGVRPGAPAVLSPALFARAGGLDGDRGFGTLLAALPDDALFRLHAPALARDVDTPDALRAAQAEGLLDRDA